MNQIVLMRHGQSAWNASNRFTGWQDVDLTPKGEKEARAAGRYLRERGILFDIAYTSLLRRAIRTTWMTLDAMDQMWLPIEKDWRLNERHYGALEGLDKAEMVDRWGREQVFRWRRSYDVRPPALDPADPRHPSNDPRYASVPREDLPAAESLEDTLRRVFPYWQEVILQRALRGECVLVVAHGNSLRALVKHLDGISDEAIPTVNIPTGIPILYRLNARGEAVERSYIGDPVVVRAAEEAAARAAQVRGKAP
jgi:2,3-bisphosphoglycerate-dependent phosphoglycerate mutase